MEGHLSIPSLIGNVLERTSPYTLVCNTVRGLGGHLRFLGETGSSWSSSLGLIALILKGHTSENKNRNRESAWSSSWNTTGAQKYTKFSLLFTCN